MRLLKNAFANLLRGVAIATFSVLLPAYLVRHMPSVDYAVWMLVLEAAGYISYLDVGLQTSLGRYIAFFHAQRDLVSREAIFSTAMVGLVTACLLGLAAMIFALWILPLFFPAVPASLLPTMRWALLIVGCTMALGLPASACNGVFIGLQRNELPAMTTGGSKLISAAGVAMLARSSGSLIWMAAVVAFSNLAAYAIQFAAMRRMVPDLWFQWSSVDKRVARELSQYCFSLTIMTVAMLFVSGFDIVMVGRFEFRAVVAYSISASFVGLIAGTLYAILNAMIAPASDLHARGDWLSLGKLVVSGTAFSVLFVALTGLPAVIYAKPLLRLWMGPAFTPEATRILTILLVANVIRLTGAAYSIILVSTGQQSLIKISPMAEGLTNFAASIILGSRFGAVGVAMGTMIGAIVSLAAHFFYNMPRTRQYIGLNRHELIMSGFMWPMICCSPLVAASVLTHRGLSLDTPLVWLAMGTSLVAALFLLRVQAMPSLRRLRLS